MNKIMLIQTGILVALLLLFGVLLQQTTSFNKQTIEMLAKSPYVETQYLRNDLGNLSTRVLEIEKFLNQAIANAQQSTEGQ